MKFAVKAYSEDGKVVSSFLEAESENQALALATRQGLTPFEIRKSDRQARSRARKKLATPALVDFCRSVADLLDGGVPLADALKIISADSMNRQGGQLAGALRNDVTAGLPLAEAIRKADFELPSNFAGMVQAGEESGFLGEMLGRLATTLERRVAVIETLRSALTYPAVLLATSIVSVAIILTVVAPTLKPVIFSTGGEPPAAAVALVAVSDWLRAYWWLLLAVLVAAPVLAWSWRRTEAGARISDRWMLRAPLIGRLVRDIESARFLSTLSALLDNGLSLAPAVSIAREAAANSEVKAAIRDIEQGVRDGRSFADGLGSATVFSDLALQMATVGEQTGQLARLLGNAAGLIETQTERRLERLKVIITPALTLLLGLMVGAVVLTLLSAIMSVNDAAL